jgi:hypothetical protein
MLGFGYRIPGFNNQIQQLDGPEALVLTPNYCYDFSGTPLVYVVFNNIPNASQQGDGPVSFSIPHTSSFGGLLTYDSQNKSANQVIYFQQPVTLSNLDISLVDVYKQPVHSVSINADDNNEIPICLSLTGFRNDQA